MATKKKPQTMYRIFELYQGDPDAVYSLREAISEIAPRYLDADDDAIEEMSDAQVQDQAVACTSGMLCLKDAKGEFSAFYLMPVVTGEGA